MGRPKKEKIEEKVVEKKDPQLAEEKLPKPDELKADQEKVIENVEKGKYLLKAQVRMIDDLQVIREVEEIFTTNDKKFKEKAIESGFVIEVKE